MVMSQRVPGEPAAGSGAAPFAVGNLTLADTGLTAPRTFTFPNAADTVVTLAATQTLTNKTWLHGLDSANHTLASQVAGRFLRATGATSFAFEAIPFNITGTVLSPSAAINVIIWRAPYACTVTAVRGYRVGGTGATINARRNGADNHLAAALSLTSANTWMDGGAVQNTAYAAGDRLEIMLVTLTGSPTQIAVQVEYTRP